MYKFIIDGLYYRETMETTRVLGRALFMTNLNVKDIVVGCRGYINADKEELVTPFVREPDYILALDSLIPTNVSKNTVIVLNTTKRPKSKRKDCSMIDASGISLEKIGRSEPGMFVIGCLAGLLTAISLKNIKKSVEIETENDKHYEAVQEGYKVAKKW